MKYFNLIKFGGVSLKVKTLYLLVFTTVSLGRSAYLHSFEPAKDDSFDWPRFRGPNGTGISNETGLLKSRPEKGPQEMWRIPVGAGY